MCATVLLTVASNLGLSSDPLFGQFCEGTEARCTSKSRFDEELSDQAQDYHYATTKQSNGPSQLKPYGKNLLTKSS